MTPERFYQIRRPEWQALSDLLKRSQRNVKQLTATEIATLSRLYRAAASDLALAQRDYPHHQVTQYLNQLVAQGHATIYQDEPLALNRLRDFITAGFPQKFRQTIHFFIASALLFIVPGVLVGYILSSNPAAAEWLLPPEFQPHVSAIENQDLWLEMSLEERPFSSSFIMANNIRVAFLAFSGGVLLGLLTVYVLVFNGLVLGGLTGLTIHYNVGFELWTFAIGHGVIELTVICMSGGAGLMLGWAIIHPGLLRRSDSLKVAARSAVNLILAAIPLLVIAGMIEGFISPNESIPPIAKWFVGIGSGILLYSYLLFTGRKQSPAK